ncbi:MAG: hypothetical protein ABMA14_03505 [Hyphomonadaceae bacterium]
MRRQSFSLWLLRDVPALLGMLASFWALIIFAMASGGRVMRTDKAGKRAHDQLALMLAYAEAKLDHALWRQAFRRLDWNPRLAPFHLIAPTTLWSDTQERIAGYDRAFRSMNAVVDAYVGHLRAQYGIAKRDLVAHGSTDAALCAHPAKGFAAVREADELVQGTNSSGEARGAQRGHAHVRGPPLNLEFRKLSPTHLAGLTCENAPACANEKAALADGLSFKIWQREI